MADQTRLDTVLPAIAALVAADTALVTLLGDATRIFYRMSQELVEQTPALTYYLPDNGMEEVFETAVIVWEIWAATLSRAMQIEKRLRLVLHSEAQQTLGGYTVILRHQGSSDEPSGRVDVMRRIVETRVEIVRQRAA